MRELDTTGAVRGGRVTTTIPDPTAPRAPDLVDRGFVASAPNRCRVAGFTHVATFSGVVCVAFVVDISSPPHRRLVRLNREADPARPGRTGHGTVATRRPRL
ncbi:hypothetical protein [Streptomyces sp. NRRL F-2664]|uniref:hypothetical protein n=1 Tax=Streptomyces sp. NRRL F-2664 TaxID=1463842 RepID=UPI000A8ED76A|nr:hypothetical protein [Streptomyces sp. NRRL F-2664]